MSKIKILVTGSCGFIASNFIRMLLHEYKNYELISIDKITRPEGIKNAVLNRSHRFYIGDITDKHFVNNIFKIELPDIVFHLGALTHVDDSNSNPDTFMQSNVLGTQILVDACVKYKVSRLVYSSTDEIYGHLSSENEPCWTESSQSNPRNYYAASKLSGELIIKAANQLYGLNYNITRSCNNFGQRQSIKNLIPKVISSILNKEKIPVFGKGAQTREWVHVDDNCRALLAILGGPANEIYNISTGYEISNLEMVNKLCNIMNDGTQLISFVEDRVGHDFRYATDSSKLRKLGWSPTVKFMDGLTNTVDWFVNNQWFINMQR